MGEDALLQIAALLILGIGATWLASLLHVPSILLLLATGILLGPVWGVLDPAAVFGESLFPLVSLAVAVILFEGGLQLKVHRIRETRVAVADLVLLGSLVTWCLCTLFARYVLDLEFRISLLLGAILVVTGPTVIMPILRNVRPRGRVGPVMRWEGIVNDPLGAMLAFLVFEWIRTGQGAEAVGPHAHAGKLVLSILAGGGVGAAGAAVLVLLLCRYWIPDHLQNPFALMMALAAYALSNALMPESGLLAVTLMGVILANQHRVSLHHIMGFEEDLRVLLIGFLFIALSARIDPEVLQQVEGETLLYVALLIVVVRPAAVFLSTLGSALTLREKTLLAWMAPRGIVAAAVASVFALRLKELDVPGAEQVVPIVFLVIVGTVAVYGLTARPLARWLQLSPRSQYGVLFVGANPITREFARELRRHHIKALLVSNKEEDVKAAREEGLEAFASSFLDRRSLEELDLAGVGCMVALTSSDELNLLAILQWEEFFGRSRVYHPPRDDRDRTAGTSYRMEGRLLGIPPLSYGHLSALHEGGATVRTLPVEEYGFPDALHERTGGGSWPAFVILPGPALAVVSRHTPAPRPGAQLIALVADAGEQGKNAG